MNKTVIVKHLENIDGSQYTLHKTDRITPLSVAFAVDALCCPSNFKYKFVPKASVPKFVDWEIGEGYYDTYKANEQTKLKNLYDKLDYKEHYVA